MKRRRQVKSACVNCRKKHAGCDNSRPCKRCVRNGTTDTCCDAPRKRRKVSATKKNFKNDKSKDYSPKFETDLEAQATRTPDEIFGNKLPVKIPTREKQQSVIYGPSNIVSIQSDVVIRKIEENTGPDIVTLNVPSLYEGRLISNQTIENESPNALDNSISSDSLPTTPHEEDVNWAVTYPYDTEQQYFPDEHMHYHNELLHESGGMNESLQPHDPILSESLLQSYQSEEDYLAREISGRQEVLEEGNYYGYGNFARLSVDGDEPNSFYPNYSLHNQSISQPGTGQNGGIFQHFPEEIFDTSVNENPAQTYF